MKAMILAAGVGSRLDPLTRQTPKPMVPIVNKPVITHIIDDLKKHGITQIMVNLHYLGDVIADYLGDGSRFGIPITCVQEDQLWGDAGSVKRAEEFFKDGTFLIVGGDDISDMDLSALFQFHADRRATGTIALTDVDDPSQFGIVLTDDDGRINRFLEKPKGEVFSKTANTGVYVLEPEVFDLIPPNTFYGFGNDVFPQLLASGKPFYGFRTHSYWKDVGNIGVYRQTNFDALSGKVEVSLPMPKQSEGVYVGDNTTVDPSATLQPPVALGHNVTIGPGASLGPNAIIGDNSAVEANASLVDTIVWDNATVQAGTHLERCIVGHGSAVSTNTAIFDGLIVDPSRRQAAQ